MLAEPSCRSDASAASRLPDPRRCEGRHNRVVRCPLATSPGARITREGAVLLRVRRQSALLRRSRRRTLLAARDLRPRDLLRPVCRLPDREVTGEATPEYLVQRPRAGRGERSTSLARVSLRFFATPPSAPTRSTSTCDTTEGNLSTSKRPWRRRTDESRADGRPSGTTGHAASTGNSSTAGSTTFRGSSC